MGWPGLPEICSWITRSHQRQLCSAHCPPCCDGCTATPHTMLLHCCMPPSADQMKETARQRMCERDIFSSNAIFPPLPAQRCAMPARDQTVVNAHTMVQPHMAVQQQQQQQRCASTVNQPLSAWSAHASWSDMWHLPACVSWYSLLQSQGQTGRGSATPSLTCMHEQRCCMGQ